jgi:nucleotide-binding universal stress UspA family protein
MTVILIVLVILLVIALAVMAVASVRRRLARPATPPSTSDRRILFPFLAQGLSPQALDAALRLAAADRATLVPVFLARVALDLPLDTALPRQCSMATSLLEAIEQRATEAGIPVDSRIDRGRNRRHALRQTIAQERFDRIVIAAASNGSPGFDAADIAWLLDNAHGEIIVLRPSADDPTLPLPAAALRPPTPALHRSRDGRTRTVSRARETARSR